MAQPMSIHDFWEAISCVLYKRNRPIRSATKFAVGHCGIYLTTM